MNDIAVITIHIHPDLLSVQRARLEEEIRVFDGVTFARFNHGVKHWLNVVYNPKSVTSKIILKRVRKWDKNAASF